MAKGKFHVNSEGRVMPCNAQPGNCPFGDDDFHYETAEAAQEESDRRNELTVKLEKETNLKDVGFTNLNASQLEVIQKARKSKPDLTREHYQLMANPKFSLEQLEVIKDAIIEGADTEDIEMFSWSELSLKKMQLAKEASTGYPRATTQMLGRITSHNFNDEQAEVYCKALKSGFDKDELRFLSDEFPQGFSANQMKAVVRAFEKYESKPYWSRLSHVRSFANPNYSAEQIDIISEASTQIPERFVQLLKEPNYYEEEMRDIVKEAKGKVSPERFEELKARKEKIKTRYKLDPKAWEEFGLLGSEQKDALIKLVVDVYPNDNERQRRSLNEMLLSMRREREEK